jgi:hypothetical protein
MRRRLRKVTVTIPTEMLDAATRITGKGITATIIEGLQELERGAQRSALRSQRGRVHFELDLAETRR